MTTLTPEAAEYLAHLTPTTCLVCRRDLTDAVSVDRGIGPECSKKHYKVDFALTEDMVLVALGHVAQLEMAGTLPPELSQALVVRKNQPREFANLLIKWAATVQANPVTILALVPAIRAIGFDVLADRLAADRSSAFLIHSEGRLWVSAPWSKELDIQFRRHGGRPGRGPKGRGNRSGYWFDWAKLDIAVCILGIFCPGVQALLVEPAGSTFFKIVEKTDADLRALLAPAPKVQGPSAAHLIVHRNGFVEVYTPYDPQFVTDLKADAGGTTRYRRWNPTLKCWEVDDQYEGVAIRLIRKHYGVEPTIN